MFSPARFYLYVLTQLLLYRINCRKRSIWILFTYTIRNWNMYPMLYCNTYIIFFLQDQKSFWANPQTAQTVVQMDIMRGMVEMQLRHISGSVYEQLMVFFFFPLVVLSLSFGEILRMLLVVLNHPCNLLMFLHHIPFDFRC